MSLELAHGVICCCQHFHTRLNDWRRIGRHAEVPVRSISRVAARRRWKFKPSEEEACMLDGWPPACATLTGRSSWMMLLRITNLKKREESDCLGGRGIWSHLQPTVPSCHVRLQMWYTHSRRHLFPSCIYHFL